MGPSGKGSGLAARVLAGLDLAETAIANSATVVILATVCWNVISRYVLRSPVAWAGDVTSIAFAWLIFIGAAAVHNRRGHISVDLVAALLPERLRRMLDWLVEAFVAAFCAYAAYLCAQQTIVSHTTAKTTVLEIPLSVLFVSLAIGFLMMAVRSALFLAGVRDGSTGS